MKFLVATDGSDHSLKTLEKAIELAIPLKAEITVLSVVPNVPIYVFPEGFSTEEFLLIEKKLEKKTEELLAQAEQKFKENGIKAVSYTHLDVYKRQGLIVGGYFFSMKHLQETEQNFLKRCFNSNFFSA